MQMRPGCMGNSMLNSASAWAYRQLCWDYAPYRLYVNTRFLGNPVTYTDAGLSLLVLKTHLITWGNKPLDSSQLTCWRKARGCSSR